MQTNAVQYFDDELPQFITSRDRKILNSKKKSQLKRENKTQSRSLDIQRIRPLTDNQKATFDAFRNDKNLLLHGVAGTGKTFIALYLALEAIKQGKIPKPIVILRSVVPSRDIGFLPGRIEEKIAIYEEPYRDICAELSGHSTSYDYLKTNGYIQFSTTSFLRGITFKNNVIIVDECQNMRFCELDTIMSRVGDGCRIIFCGDFRQTDLIRDEEQKGLHKFMNILKHMPSFDSIEFNEQDIVRGKLVKEYIITKMAQGV